MKLSTPLKNSDVENLKAGDKVLLNGIIYTGRDAAHKRLIDLLDKGEDLPFEVKHITEILVDMLNNNEISFKTEDKIKITYHDPCHLGRHMNLFDIPRELISKIPIGFKVRYLNIFSFVLSST